MNRTRFDVVSIPLGFAPNVSAETPSPDLRYAKKRVEVWGHEMAYIEAGSGRPIVFLHGNRTSSYLWRNVIPHLEELGRCLAPDLIGMGEWLILNHNLFVERILPGSVLRVLSKVEMESYRAPYGEPGESRRTTLTWPCEVPFDGEPADTHRVIADYAAWLPTTVYLPKLWFDVSDGVLILRTEHGQPRSCVEFSP